MSMFDGTPKPPGFWHNKMREWAHANEVRKTWEQSGPGSVRMCECHTETLAQAWAAAIAEDEDRRMNAARMKWEHEQLLQKETHFAACGVPDGVASTLLNPRPNPTLNRVTAFMDSKDTFLLLFGDPNSGKTVSACSAFVNLKAPLWNSEIGHSWEWYSKAGLFVSAHEVSNASYFDAESKRKLQRMANVKLLVLDDLGAELLSDGWRANFDALIDARYGGKRRTILTTNVSARKNRIPGEVGEKVEHKASPFEERYGARAARRIRERGSVFQAER